MSMASKGTISAWLSLPYRHSRRGADERIRREQLTRARACKRPRLGVVCAGSDQTNKKVRNTDHHTILLRHVLRHKTSLAVPAHLHERRSPWTSPPRALGLVSLVSPISGEFLRCVSQSASSSSGGHGSKQAHRRCRILHNINQIRLNIPAKTESIYISAIPQARGPRKVPVGAGYSMLPV
jgi:hypothetical protein